MHMISLPLAYFCINNHQYLIRDTKKIKSLIERAKKQKDINFNSSILQSKEPENIFKRDDILENIDIKELKNHISEDKPTTVIMYSRTDFSYIYDLFIACIEYYNTIASIDKSSKTKITMLNITLEGHKFILCSDPNFLKL